MVLSFRLAVAVRWIAAGRVRDGPEQSRRGKDVILYGEMGRLWVVVEGDARSD